MNSQNGFQITLKNCHDILSSRIRSNRFSSPGRRGVRDEVRSGQFIKATAVSTEKAVEVMKFMKRQIEVTMFAVGAKEIGEPALSLSKG